TPTLSTPLFSTVIGAGSDEEFVPIAFMVDDCKYIYFSGHEAEPGLPITAGAFQTYGGFYLGVLEPNASGLNFATYYGGSDDHVDGGTSRFDPNGIVYQGVCSDGGFNTTPGAFSSTYPPSPYFDIGVFKIDFQVNTLDAVTTVSPSTVGCAPYTVTFTNASTGNSYNWNFDDGSPIDSSIAPTHTFVNPGIYDVMLIAFDSTSCMLADTTYLTINVSSPVPVIASFSYSIDCTTASVDAQSTGTPVGPGILYEWEMGDGTIYTDTIVSHFYATPGTYTITLIVVDTICGNTDTTIMQVLVNGPLVDLGPDLLTCTPLLVLDALNPGATYLWQNGSNNQIFNVTDFGTYFVEVTEGGCTVSDTIVISQDTIEVILPSDAILCIGSSIILDAQNFGSNYLWSDGSITQTITVNSQGTYWVEITEGICYASDTIIIDFYSPAPLFSYIDTIGCEPLITQFTDLSTTSNSTITSWYWTFGDGFDSNAQSPSHQYTSSGVYDVTLTTTTADGCSSSIAQPIQITVYPSPIALFAFTPNQPMSGDLISFVDQSVNASTWNWYFGDGTNSILQNPKHTFEDIANFEVQLIVANEQCIDSITRLITIQEELIFYVPNTFTPDGDQYNNTFFPVFTSGFDPFDYQLIIFNRWGEVIFESFNSENGWDGTYGGKLVQYGTYTWKIEFGDINTDERHIVHGHVNMIR
ncbi:MAG: gliding motility-associated-like protein, partial [Nonlabens sp.]